MDEMRLDDELKAALNVDPSPEFLTRVRTRIAAEPEPSRWRPVWMMAPAVAAVVLAVMLWPRSEAPAPTPVEPAPAAVTAADSSPAAAPIVEPSRRVVPVRPHEEPEVVIAEAEKRGFEMLLLALARNSLPPVPEVTTTPVAAPPPIEIESFTVEPLQITRLATEEANP